MADHSSNRAAWQVRIDEFERSGLTARAFAEQHGIGVDGLKYWWRRLRPGRSMRRSQRDCAADRPHQGLVPIVVASPKSSGMLALVELPSGLRVSIPVHCDPAPARALIGALLQC